nr:hypothetical protein 16 [bacterium]
MTPINVIVQQGDDQHEVEGVETWWYEGINLHVRLATKDVETFPGGNVMGRY